MYFHLYVKWLVHFEDLSCSPNNTKGKMGLYSTSYKRPKMKVIIKNVKGIQFWLKKPASRCCRESETNNFTEQFFLLLYLNICLTISSVFD